jgi:hypothetical protein
LRTQPLSLCLGFCRGLGLAKHQDSWERARCKALLFGVHKVGSVGSVRFGSFWAGGRCFVLKQLVVCWKDVVWDSWVWVVSDGWVLSTAFPGFSPGSGSGSGSGSGGSAAFCVPRYLKRASKQASKQCCGLWELKQWRRVRLFALIAVSSLLFVGVVCDMLGLLVVICLVNNMGVDGLTSVQCGSRPTCA